MGDSAYWLTRPISRVSLLGSKALFLALFLSAPSFLVQTAVLAITGFSPAHHLGSLLWNQALLFLYFPAAAAVAAITPNFRGYALASLATAAVSLSLLIYSANQEGGQWGGFDWIRDGVISLIFLAAMAAVVMVMYTSRRALAARLIAAGGVCVLLLLMVTNIGWRQAFAVTSALAGAPDEATRRIRMNFDAAATPAVRRGRHDEGLRVAVPVRVTAIPPGRQLISERISVTIQAPGAPAWRSSWREQNELAARTAWRDSDAWIAADGQYWLSFDIPTVYFEILKEKPTTLRANIALSEFTNPLVTKLPIQPREYPVASVGRCSLDTIVAYTMISCVTPFERRVATDFLIQPHKGGPDWKSSGCCTISYGPIGFDGKFSVWSEVGSMPSGPNHLWPEDEVTVEVRRPLSHFEREMEIDGIRLPQFGVRQ